MYSLLCRHAKFSLLPNQQAADEELSTYKYGPSAQEASCLPLKRFLEKHKKCRTILLLVVLLGACMVIGDGVITPAISGKLLLIIVIFLAFFFFLVSLMYCILGSFGSYDAEFSSILISYYNISFLKFLHS